MTTNTPFDTIRDVVLYLRNCVKSPYTAKMLEDAVAALASEPAQPVAMTGEQWADFQSQLTAIHGMVHGDARQAVFNLATAFAELRALSAQPEAKAQAVPTLAERIAERMAVCYKSQPLEVATACDGQIDRSGNLLGWVREAARAQPEAKPQTAEQKRPHFEWWYTTRGVYEPIGSRECAVAWAAWLASGGYTAPGDWKVSPMPWGLPEAKAQPVVMTDEREAAEREYKAKTGRPVGMADWCLYWDGWQDRAALSAQPEAKAQAAQEGWKLVPEQSSAAMEWAWNRAECTFGSHGRKQPMGPHSEWKTRYAAMLAAAPQPPAPSEQRKPLTQAAADVLAERQRQISAEGWTPEHDDEHSDGEMALAASCYACAGARLDDAARDWPWADSWWKPSTERRNLIKAGALILAEIERLDRAGIRSTGGDHA